MNISNMTTSIDFNVALSDNDLLKIDTNCPTSREYLHSYESNYRKMLSSTIEAPKKGAKKVTFAAKVQIIENKSFLSEIEINSSWLMREELKKIQMSARIIREGLRQKDAAAANGVSSTLSMAYKKTKFMLSGNFEELVKLPLSRPDQDLTKWCLHNDGRRGLERFAAVDYSSYRHRDVKNARKAVLNEQALQRKLHINDPEEIAKISRDITNRSRSFAGFMGVADAAVAKSTRKVNRRRQLSSIQQ